jgi:hypothetical protein
MLTCEGPLGLPMASEVDNRKGLTHDFVSADIAVRVNDFE